MSTIEWTDQTWNPATGCTKISPGCKNCYMFRLYPRLHGMGVRGYEEDANTVQIFPDRLNQPDKWKKPRMVFVNSMSDAFHADIPHDFNDAMFEQMAKNPRHTFQILTKRPENAVEWWEASDLETWPPHVWIGVSVENNKYRERIAVLSDLPAPIKFVSAEPLIGPVYMGDYLSEDMVQWVIAGGESGPGARPMDEQWVVDIRDACESWEVPFFFKQWGGVRDKRSGDKAVLEGRTWQQFPSHKETTDV